MRVKKKIRNLLSNFDLQVKLPNRFDLYVEKIKKSQRLIIKSKNEYLCGNCNYKFQKKFKINSYHRCPHCREQLLVKSNRLKKLVLNDQFAILERFDDEYFIIRAFDVETIYHNGLYTTHVCEYGRQIYEEFFNKISEVYNDNISATTSGKWINHRTFLNSNWKENGSYYHTLGEIYRLYPYNLKNVLKNTKYQYCQIEKYAKKRDYFDVVMFLDNSSFSTEMLIKSGLYDLAYSLMRNLSMGYILTDINYKYIKSNLEFIKKYKLSLDELLLFQYLKKKNIKIIRKYSKNNIDFKLLSRFKVDLTKADENIECLDNYLEIYEDYLKFAEELKYDLSDKKILYPKNVLEEHNKLCALIEVKKNKKINDNLLKRYEYLAKNIYKDKKYIIFPASDIESLIDESAQMNNCVKTYAKSASEGICDIYFMRLISAQKKSLVTVEVRNNRVVQQRAKNNQDTMPEQKEFLKKWEEKALVRGGK